MTPEKSPFKICISHCQSYLYTVGANACKFPFGQFKHFHPPLKPTSNLNVYVCVCVPFFKTKYGFIPVFKWFPLNAKCIHFEVEPQSFSACGSQQSLVH